MKAAQDNHYYKTKCEISGEGAPWKKSFDRIQNGRQLAIIYINMPDIG